MSRFNRAAICLVIGMLWFGVAGVVWARGDLAASATKVNLFEAGVGGYVAYRIPGIVVARDGTILVYCEGRKNGTLDWDEIEVLLRRSVDGGKTWDRPTVIARTPAGAAPNPAAVGRGLHPSGRTTNNAVAIADPRSGAIHFLYCVNYQQCFYMRSDDAGKTFSKPTEITATFDAFRPAYNWKTLAVGPGHGIGLAGGRLLAAVWLSTGAGAGAHHPSCVSTIYSDDAGKTWSRGDLIADNSPATPDPNESELAALPDGRVVINMRNESPRNRRLVSSSPDGATRWSPPRYDEALFDPVCFASLLSLPGDRPRLLFSNPDSSGSNWKSTMKPRRNLTIRESDDGGAHWPRASVLEPGPAGYSDLAQGADGSIYCFYERGELKSDMFHTRYLCFARFTLNRK